MSNIETIKLIDSNGVVFGVKQTGSVLHAIIDSIPLASGAATLAKQLPAGHTVTVINLATLATHAKQLPDNHNVAVSNMIPAVETGLATSLKQLADNHNVTVSNPAADPETGLATSANQETLLAELQAKTDLDETQPVSDPMLEIARGNISGMSHINKFGDNDSITKNTTEDVWDGGGTYSFPATALMTKISQTADQADMRGETIEVQGLDASWDLVIQNVNLNASNTTTPVVLSTPLIRCFRMVVFANFVNDSPIRIHNDAESVDYAIIEIGNNQTLMAIYTIPNGKTGYMTSFYADQSPELSGTKDPASIKYKLWMADRDNSHEFQLKNVQASIKSGTTSFQHFFKPYLKVTQKTDIKISASVTNDKDGHAHAGFDIILIDN